MASENSLKIGVFILDDHPSTREGLKTILEASDRYCAAGMAGSTDEARSALHTLNTTNSLPSLLLADNNLKSQSGIDFIRDIAPLYAGMRCVAISVSIRFDTIAEALAGGAKGYIGKDQDEASMIRVLDAVMRGEIGIEGEALSVLAENALRLSFARMKLEQSRYDALTPREKEVFRLLASNKGTSDIAKYLELSAKTIDNIRSAILGKLALQDKFELYKYAIRIGIIEE